MSLMAWWRSQSSQPATGLRGIDLETQTPEAILGLLRQLPDSSDQQQASISNSQNVETLVRLLQHSEPLLRQEACLALTYLTVSPGVQQQCVAEPLVAALVGKLQAPTPRSSSSTGGSAATGNNKGRSRLSSTGTSSSHDMGTHAVPAAATTWWDIPRLAAAAFLATAGPSSMEELCRTRPTLAATLAQLAVDQVEGALHGAVAGLQQQPPWQLPAASAAMAGLLQLLSCGGQQVACAVVHQVCRLAYSTAVLDQLGVGLAGYPGAVAAVVAVVQPWSQEGFREATSTATTSTGSSSSQWPGGAAQLQAEAMATLYVLSSLGGDSRELVTHTPYTLDVLLRGLSPHHWREEPQKPYDLQNEPWPLDHLDKVALLGLCVVFLRFLFLMVLGLPNWCFTLAPIRVLGGYMLRSNREVINRCTGLWPVNKLLPLCYGWTSSAKGLAGLVAAVAHEPEYWGVGIPALVIAAALLPVLLPLLSLIRRGQLPAVVSKEQVWLRQQWAAYCLWQMVTKKRVSPCVLQPHMDLAKQMLHGAAPHNSHSTVLLAHVASVFGVSTAQRLAASSVPPTEPPMPPCLAATWGYQLQSWALRTTSDAGMFGGILVAGCVCLPVGCTIWLVTKLPYLGVLHHLASRFLSGGCLVVCLACCGLLMPGVYLMLQAAMALVIIANSQLCSYQVVVASRLAPDGTLLRTWLQPVTYLTLDFSPHLAVQSAVASTPIARHKCYDTFGQWPGVLCFEPGVCKARHVHREYTQWLKRLNTLATVYSVAFVAGSLALWLFTATTVRSVPLQWEYAASAASLKVWWMGCLVDAVMLQLSCIALHPGWAWFRHCISSCWCVTTAMCRTVGHFVLGGAAACVRVITLFLPCVAVSGACRLAAAIVRLVVWVVVLPAHAGLHLCRVSMAAWQAVSLTGRAGAPAADSTAPALQRRQSSGAGAKRAHTLEADAAHPQHSSRTLALHHAGTTQPSGHQPQRQQQQVEAAAAGLPSNGEAPVPAATKEAASSPNRSILPAAKPTDVLRRRGGAQQRQVVAPAPGALAPARVEASTAAAHPPTAATAASDASGGVSIAASACPLPLIPRGIISTAAPQAQLLGHAVVPAPHRAAADAWVEQQAAPGSASAGGSVGVQSQMQVAGVFDNTTGFSPPVAGERRTNIATVTSPAGGLLQQQPHQEQHDATAAQVQHAAQDAAQVAAAAAIAAGGSVEEVFLAAAQAAAEAVQSSRQLSVADIVEVARCAAAAARLLPQGLTSGPGHNPAPPAAAGVAGTQLSDSSAAAPAVAAAAAGPYAREVGASSTAVPGPPPAPPAPSSPAAAPRPRKPRSRAECVVCLDARPSVTTHPCGHRVLCGGCAALVAAGKGECPMCRAPVVRYEAGAPGGRG